MFPVDCCGVANQIKAHVSDCPIWGVVKGKQLESDRGVAATRFIIVVAFVGRWKLTNVFSIGYAL